MKYNFRNYEDVKHSIGWLRSCINEGGYDSYDDEKKSTIKSIIEALVSSPFPCIPLLIAVGLEFDSQKRLQYYKLLSSDDKLEAKLNEYIEKLSGVEKGDLQEIMRQVADEKILKKSLISIKVFSDDYAGELRKARKLLEVREDATLQEIGRAFRMLSLDVHSDKGGKDDNKMQQLSNARDVLIDHLSAIRATTFLDLFKKENSPSLNRAIEELKLLFADQDTDYQKLRYAVFDVFDKIDLSEIANAINQFDQSSISAELKIIEMIFYAFQLPRDGAKNNKAGELFKLISEDKQSLILKLSPGLYIEQLNYQAGFFSLFADVVDKGKYKRLCEEGGREIKDDIEVEIKGDIEFFKNHLNEIYSVNEEEKQEIYLQTLHLVFSSVPIEKIALTINLIDSNRLNESSKEYDDQYCREVMAVLSAFDNYDKQKYGNLFKLLDSDKRELLAFDDERESELDSSQADSESETEEDSVEDQEGLLFRIYGENEEVDKSEISDFAYFLEDEANRRNEQSELKNKARLLEIVAAIREDGGRALLEDDIEFIKKICQTRPKYNDDWDKFIIVADDGEIDRQAEGLSFIGTKSQEPRAKYSASDADRERERKDQEALKVIGSLGAGIAEHGQKLFGTNFEEMESKLHELLAQIEDAKRKLAKYEGSNEQLLKEQGALENRIELQKYLLSQLDEDFERHLVALEEAELRLREANEELRRFEGLANEITAKRKLEIESLNVQISLLNSEIATLTERRDEFGHEISQNKKTLENLLKEIQNLSQSHDNLLKSISVRQKELQSLEERLAPLRKLDQEALDRVNEARRGGLSYEEMVKLGDEDFGVLGIDGQGFVAKKIDPNKVPQFVPVHFYEDDSLLQRQIDDATRIKWDSDCKAVGRDKEKRDTMFSIVCVVDKAGKLNYSLIVADQRGVYRTFLDENKVLEIDGECRKVAERVAVTSDLEKINKKLQSDFATIDETGISKLQQEVDKLHKNILSLSSEIEKISKDRNVQEYEKRMSDSLKEGKDAAYSIFDPEFDKIQELEEKRKELKRNQDLSKKQQELLEKMKQKQALLIKAEKLKHEPVQAAIGSFHDFQRDEISKSRNRLCVISNETMNWYQERYRRPFGDVFRFKKEKEDYYHDLKTLLEYPEPLTPTTGCSIARRNSGSIETACVTFYAEEGRKIKDNLVFLGVPNSGGLMVAVEFFNATNSKGEQHEVKIHDGFYRDYNLGSRETDGIKVEEAKKAMKFFNIKAVAVVEHEHDRASTSSAICFKGEVRNHGVTNGNKQGSIIEVTNKSAQYRKQGAWQFPQEGPLSYSSDRNSVYDKDEGLKKQICDLARFYSSKKYEDRRAVPFEIQLQALSEVLMTFLQDEIITEDRKKEICSLFGIKYDDSLTITSQSGWQKLLMEPAVMEKIIAGGGIKALLDRESLGDEFRKAYIEKYDNGLNQLFALSGDKDSFVIVERKKIVERENDNGNNYSFTYKIDAKNNQIYDQNGKKLDKSELQKLLITLREVKKAETPLPDVHPLSCKPALSLAQRASAQGAFINA